MGYIQFAIFIIRTLGIEMYLEEIVPYPRQRDPPYFYDAIRLYFDKNNEYDISKLEEDLVLALQKESLLQEADEAYIKAIALRANLPPYTLGRAELNHAKILIILGKEGYKHYAREAEKDLRKHLNKFSDDISALKKLGEAVFIYEDNEKIREARLDSIRARLKEASIRQDLKEPPPALKAVGKLQNPYPENWHELTASIRKKYGYRCTQCGAQDVELHVHHVVPLSLGGNNDPDNLVALCDYCHSQIHPRMGSGSGK